VRRLDFIAQWFESIIFNENDNYDQPELNEYFLKELLEYRKINVEMCNMILVLLVVCVFNCYLFVKIFISKIIKRLVFSLIYHWNL
jgi:hypothetical protein